MYKVFSACYWTAIRIASAFGHAKACKAIGYRKKEWSTGPMPQRMIWIHAASAGEGNQVLPLLPHLKKIFNAGITISFFSPSGYDFHCDNPAFDRVVMLPPASKKNAREFIGKIAPLLAIFVRNELWYDYLSELSSDKIPSFLINAPHHVTTNPPFYLKGYLTKCLSCFTSIFPADETTGNLANIHELTGNTKWELTSGGMPAGNVLLDSFADERPCIVIGSSWKAEEALMSKWLADQNVRLIIAPHDNSEERLNEIARLFPGSVRYSALDSETGSAGVLILDEYGLLRSAYRYADIAMVGGGFGKGIHNILEPASEGLPVLFGPHHKKFPEAQELILKGCAYCIENEKDLRTILRLLLKEPDLRKQIKEKTDQVFAPSQGHSKRLAEAIRSFVNL